MALDTGANKQHIGLNYQSDANYLKHFNKRLDRASANRPNGDGNFDDRQEKNG